MDTTKKLQSFDETSRLLTLIYLFLVKSLSLFIKAQKSLMLTKNGLLVYIILKLLSSSFLIESFNLSKFKISTTNFSAGADRNYIQ